MTVYELIQELSQYKPNAEVDFHVEAKFDADVDVDLNGEDSQTIGVVFDEDVDIDGISDNERSTYRPNVTINLTY